MIEYGKKQKVKNVIQQDEILVADPEKSQAVFNYKLEDPKDVRNFKTIQRQMDFNTTIE